MAEWDGWHSERARMNGIDGWDEWYGMYEWCEWSELYEQDEWEELDKWDAWYELDEWFEKRMNGMHGMDETKWDEYEYAGRTRWHG